MHASRILSTAALAALVIAPVAQAHIGWSGTRNFDTLVTNITETSSDRTVGGAYGWLDGTDANWGDSHRQVYYRFVLSSTTSVSVSAARNDVVGQTGAAGVFVPAFSLYRIGTPPMVSSTHDGATATRNHLTATFGTGGTAEVFTDTNTNGFWDPGEAFTDANGNSVWDSAGIDNSGKEGAFNALGDWTIFNDSAQRADFLYIGHRADGSYDPVSGISGDGAADGTVSMLFENLGDGTYFIAVGGATNADQLNFRNSGEYGTANVTRPTYGLAVSVTAIPEPSSVASLAGLGALGLAALRRRPRA